MGNKNLDKNKRTLLAGSACLAGVVPLLIGIVSLASALPSLIGIFRFTLMVLMSNTSLTGDPTVPLLMSSTSLASGISSLQLLMSNAGLASRMSIPLLLGWVGTLLTIALPMTFEKLNKANINSGVKNNTIERRLMYQKFPLHHYCMECYPLAGCKCLERHWYLISLKN